MGLNLPTQAVTIFDRIVVDVAAKNPLTNPGFRNSFLRGLLGAIANRFLDFYFDLVDVLKEALPGSAVAKLPDWAATRGVIQLSGTKSTGNFVLYATSGTTLPANKFFSASDGTEWKTTPTTPAVELSEDIDVITDLGGGEANILFNGTHQYVTGNDLVISGCVVATEYNATHYSIEVIDTLNVKIFGHGASADETSDSPGIAKTWQITAAVTALEVGVAGNLDAGAQVTMNTPEPGVNDIGVVDSGTISGGVDQEAFLAFEERYREERHNPIAHFNAAAIRKFAKEVNGVTRVFVDENTPAVGATRVYFMRDNDADPIPSAGEVTVVNDVLQAIRPANMVIADLEVLAPTAEVVNFVFDGLVPNTSTMQASVEANLKQYFAENTEVGEDVSEDGIRAAIKTTIDSVTGATVTSFNYTTPASGDITVTSGKIGKVGTLGWP